MSRDAITKYCRWRDVYQDIREFTQQEHNQKALKWYPWHLVNIAKGSISIG